MSGHSEYVITPADRTTLLQGPVGAILMLGGDRTAGSPAVPHVTIDNRADPPATPEDQVTALTRLAGE